MENATDCRRQPARALALRSADRSTDRVWLVLALATAVTWFAGDSGRAGVTLVGFVFALAVVKGGLVALDFMELRHAPPLFRRLVIGWLLAVTAVILIAYLIGQS